MDDSRPRSKGILVGAEYFVQFQADAWRRLPSAHNKMGILAFRASSTDV